MCDNIKPLTIKELKERIEFLLTSGQVKEEDYVFYNLPYEDEGTYDSLRPVGNISGTNIDFLLEDKDIFNELIKMKGIVISFVSPKVD